MLLDFAAEIHKFQPHILVTNAGLANFNHYFITSLRPAPIQIGLVQGPPPQFAPPTLDWGIVWTRHPLIDCPVDCSWIPIFLDAPKREEIEPRSRAELGLPDDACVLLSAGRHVKFQDQTFWKTIVEVLTAEANSYFLAVGVTEDQIPFFADLVTADVRERIRCLGWRKDFLRILATADVVIDTYPNGGGQVIVQAMSLAIPVAAHRNDYLRPFDQNDWSPVEDFLNEPDLLVDRGDFVAFKRVLNKLIEDPEYRRDAGLRCQAQHVRQVDPATTVRRCEGIFTELYQRHSA
jgi:glycosyltransferase involved in cell wall biosynthesis